jgi:hypothetical protein
MGHPFEDSGESVTFDVLPLCDRVRTSCRRVVDAARLVTIDDGALDRLSDHLQLRPRDPTSVHTVEPTTEPELREEEIGPSMLVLALDAINFGSGYHDIVRKRPGLSGSRTMAASLQDYVRWTGPVTPGRLQNLTTSDCSQIFGQELDGGAQEELMVLFTTALVDLGEWLERSGGIADVLTDAAGSAEVFAQRLTDMRFYRDVEHYGGEPVAFYKRAQITAADLSRQIRPSLFSDLHRLTAFADNLVPHVLRIEGVLDLDPRLVQAIDTGRLLDPGGAAEVELRAAGVECVERLASRTGLMAMDIDAVLWERGSLPRMKATPRHRARSVFY